MVFSLPQAISQDSISINFESQNISDDTIVNPMPGEKYLKNMMSAVMDTCFCTSRIFFRMSVSDIGEISNVELVLGTGTCWDEHVKQAIVNSSPWIPAKKNGVNVSCEFVYPVYVGTPISVPCNGY